MPIHTNGPVLTGTRRNLIEGLRAAPMAEAAVDAIIRQVVNFTERVVDTYESQVAANEVGAEGSGIASVEPIVGIRPPTALMYGRVQSGKTAAMILTDTGSSKASCCIGTSGRAEESRNYMGQRL